MISTPIGSIFPPGLPSASSFLRFSPASLAAPSAAPSAINVPLSASAPALQHGKGTLFYGGQPAATPYHIGCKPQVGVSFKKQKRHELIARMENAQLSEGQIATLLGITTVRLRTIKQHPDYLKARMAVTFGIIIDTDSKLDQIREQRKDFLRQMLPPALQVIANAVNTPALSYADRKLQVAVAQDILDREGTFAKISRTEVKPVEHFQWETADADAGQVLNVLKGTLRISQQQEIEDPAGSRASIEKIIEISRAFSSGVGPTPESQQEALRSLEER